MLRVLITLQSLHRWGGVQTYTDLLARRLTSAGCTVAVYSLRFGAPSRALAEAGIQVLRSPAEVRRFDPEVVHAQHRQAALLIAAVVPDVPLVFHAHGVIPADEQPPSVDIDVRAWVAVSTEVAENLRTSTLVGEVTVLPNPVDTVRFASTAPIAAVPRRAVVLGRELTSARLAPLEHACRALGIDLTPIGAAGHPWRSDMPAVFRETDIVFALGRGAIEAMSCSRAVFIFGAHGSDGWVTLTDLDEISASNFSGRCRSLDLDGREIAEIIRIGYDQGMGATNRQIVDERFSIDSHIPELMQIYDSACSAQASGVRSLPTDELELLMRRLGTATLAEERWNRLRELRGFGAVLVLRRARARARQYSNTWPRLGRGPD